MRYNIQKGNDLRNFAVDPDTGRIYTVRPIFISMAQVGDYINSKDDECDWTLPHNEYANDNNDSKLDSIIQHKCHFRPTYSPMPSSMVSRTAWPM